MHSQQALIRVSFIQTTVFIEQGLSSREQGSCCCKLHFSHKSRKLGLKLRHQIRHMSLVSHVKRPPYIFAEL